MISDWKHSLDVQSQMAFSYCPTLTYNYPAGQMQGVPAWPDPLAHGRARTHANPEDWPFHTTGFLPQLTSQKNHSDSEKLHQRKGVKKNINYLPNIIPSREVKWPLT